MSLAKGRFLFKTASALFLHRTILWAGLVLACAALAGVSTAAPAQRPCYTLAECVDLALDQNADVLIARKHLEEAAGAIIVARAGFLPSLTSYANYEYLEPYYASLSNTATNRDFIWNITVRLTETVYSGGAVRSQMAIARLQSESRMADYEAAVNQVIMNSRIAFYDILRNQAEVGVHQQAVDFLRQQMDNERDKLQVGNGQKLNVLRAEVNLALEQSALVDAGNRLKNSYLALGELLAIACSADDDQPPFEIEGDLEFHQAPPSLDECLWLALAQRPELVARADDVTVQKKQLVIDHSAILPQLNAYAGYDMVSEPSIAAHVEYYNGYVAGVQFSWNIFDGFAAKGRMQATRARIEEAETAYDAIHRTIQTEVLLAYHELEKAGETIRTQSANVELARQSVALATDNFNVGLISQLELLQSQLDLTRAQTAEVSARFDYNAALARLQRAMGSDFHLMDESAGNGNGK